MEDQNNQSNKIYFKKPSLMYRIKSMLIDSIVIIVLMFLISAILESLNIHSGTIRGICLGLVILYEPIFVSFGATIGQRIMGLRVRDLSNYTTDKANHKLNFFYSLVRYAAKILFGWISLLTIHSDAYGQAIHDKLGGSVMTFR